MGYALAIDECSVVATEVSEQIARTRLPLERTRFLLGGTRLRFEGGVVAGDLGLLQRHAVEPVGERAAEVYGLVAEDTGGVGELGGAVQKD